ncbi:hypothetical protein ACQP2F_15435 [Actinoplanes sp. CA-030573]|uniref:hypothetical protein n=1 Tax=Actinoplanes sp. CA-030573 TaxID=3239898 RepID=UPI003D8E7753
MRVRSIGAALSGLVISLGVLAGTGVSASAAVSQVGWLLPGESLSPNQQVQSPSKTYNLIMQTDGNLVLYGPRGAEWSTGTWGSGANLAIMQPDGNFVVYAPNSAKFDTQTWGNPNAKLAVQDDGNVVVYAANNGPAKWSSKYGPAATPPAQHIVYKDFVSSGSGSTYSLAQSAASANATASGRAQGYSNCNIVFTNISGSAATHYYSGTVTVRCSKLG